MLRNKLFFRLHRKTKAEFHLHRKHLLRKHFSTRKKKLFKWTDNLKPKINLRKQPLRRWSRRISTENIEIVKNKWNQAETRQDVFV
jgi:hypothetical protein